MNQNDLAAFYRDADVALITPLRDGMNLVTFFFNLVTFHRKLLKYSGVLNSEIVWYSDHGDLFARRMVLYSDAGYHGSLVFRSQFG